MTASPTLRARWALALGLLLAASAQAKLVEEQFDLPVKTRNAWGKVIEQPIRVTVFTDDSRPGPHPILLLNHGRATEGDARAAMGRARFSEASRWFAERGFLVAVPTRIGYGVSGGEDVEDSGSCNNRQYPPVYQAAADQSLQLLTALLARPDTLKDRTVLMGQSFGGATTVTLASLNPPGVVAAINVAGGGGGDPKTHPGEPCSSAQLARMFASYGKTARVPMLWLYTENDLFFGPRHPRDWAARFREAGGSAEFVQFPPHGEDGHALFSRFPKVWQPVVADYLRRQGFDLQD